MLTRFDVTLVRDEMLDWRMNVTLMPASDPMIWLHGSKAILPFAGRLTGPIAELVRWED